MEPLSPALDCPVSKEMSPLTPAVPASAVSIVKLPLDVWVLKPVLRLMSPPEADAVVSPADKTTWPPVPVSPEPTESEIAPALPPTAWPDDIEIEPLSPAVDLPVAKEISPLTPDAPASTVFTDKLPLDVAVLYPVFMETSPPLALSVVSPAVIRISPPEPVSPEPTRKVIAPALPFFAFPVETAIRPESP
jgi:hypothetical protein